MEENLDDVYIAKGYLKYMLEGVAPDCGSVNFDILPSLKTS